MVTLKAADEGTEKVKELPLVGVDLICLIDRSHSMCG